MNGPARRLPRSIALLAAAEDAAWGYECPQSPPPGPTEDYQGLQGAVFELDGRSIPYRFFIPGVSHSINNRGYDLPGFIDWMFAQSLPGEDPETEDGDDAVDDVLGGEGASTEQPPGLSDTTIADNPNDDRPGAMAPTDLGSAPEGSGSAPNDGLSMPIDGEVNRPSLDGAPPTSSRASAGGCALTDRRAPSKPGTWLLLAGLGVALPRLRRSRARRAGDAITGRGTHRAPPRGHH